MRKLLVILVACMVLTITGCSNNANQNDTPNTDEVVNINREEHAAKFKAEYEELNGKINEAKGVEYPTVEVSEDNPIVYKTLTELVEFVNTDQTGVIYLGFSSCPWCRNALPALLEQAKETGIDTIYYTDIKELRDTKVLNDDGKIETTKEAGEGYYELIEALGDSVHVYDGLNDESVRRLYAPTVIVVKEGEVILYQQSTVSTQLDPYTPLTEEEYAQLKKIYKDGFMKMLYDVCDSAC